MDIMKQKKKEFEERFSGLSQEAIDAFESEKDLSEVKRQAIWQFIEQALKEAIEATRKEIFNSKKGDKVYIPKTDKTEQVWQCVNINHI